GRLLVLPDGPLHYLPFSVLVCDSTGLPRMPVRYGFSLAVLELAARDAPAGTVCTGWAPFAEAGRDSLAPLPHTARELEALPAGTRLFVGEQATLAAFRQMAPRAGLIHLATHARGGTQPRIAFADSVLPAAELYRMELQAALVVLSACETLPGKEVAGEGVMGLARAFAYAGARGLVASLWQVNDATTAELWTAFYRHLAAGRPADEALWQAQRDYLARVGRPDYQRHPWYWAGFVYLGPAETLPAHLKAGRPWWQMALALVALAAAGFICRKAWRHLRKRNNGGMSHAGEP
ncbi:MAG: CHAT domain-containing protein, partial [Bacteroidetes bacterium]